VGCASLVAAEEGGEGGGGLRAFWRAAATSTREHACR
jgi:hypothetical protein